MKLFNNGRALRGLPRLLLLAAMVTLPVAACDTDELVAVVDPEQLRPDDLTGLAAVPALVNGALRQFQGGYSGFGDDAFLSSSAVISDEFYYGDTFTTRQAADLRSMQPAVLGNISDAAYSRLHQARLNARRAFALVEEFSTPQTATADAVSQAQLRAIEAYTYVTLSEGWCGAVPFSRIADTGPIDPAAIEFGAPIGTGAMNDTAVARLNEALVKNANNNLAKVGKGRALLNLGRYAEAAAAVSTVPTTFVFRLEHSVNTSGQNNPISSLQLNGRYGIANLEGADAPTGLFRPDAPTSGNAAPPATAPGAEGIAFRGLQDPRVPYRSRPNCFTTSVRCWINNNYPDFESEVPLASGVEARLIEAEAAYNAGNFTLMMGRLDALRAQTAQLLAILHPRQVQVFPAIGPPSLAPLADPGTAAGRRQLLFTERALWLFNTGHRQGDLRRLVRNYGVSSNQAFPSGPNFRGSVFGDDVSYPVPFAEENNPQFVRSACDLTKA